MKVLFLTKYDYMGASSRYRFFQFYDYYKMNDFESHTQAFFNDEYLLDLYSGKKNIFLMIKAYYKRLLKLFFVKKYDLLVIEKELFPYMPAFFEKILNMIGINYIVDYDDAIFHQYDNSNSVIIKLILSKKIAKVMKYSKLVIAGNDYLANYASHSAHANSVKVVPTVIDLEKYDKVKTTIKNENETVIGWIGSPSTSKYLSFLEEVFIKLSEKHNIKINIIGTSVSPFKNLEVNMIPWSEEHEIEEMKKFDIGIMPLTDSLWERGKCGFKLIQYMGCALPIIGSPVGVNSEIIEQNKNGFLASEVNEWFDALNSLIEDEQLRKKFGINGRRKVEKYYSKQVIQKELLKLYKGLLCVE